MAGFIQGYAVVWLVILVSAIVRITKAKNNKPAPPKSKLAAPKENAADISGESRLVFVVPQNRVKSEKQSLASMEDREHDWLARQLKEEQRIYMRGDFMDLGVHHKQDSNAKTLKRLHMLQHDDSIDTGELKTAAGK